MHALLLVTLLAATPHPLHYSTAEDVSATAAAAAVWGAEALLKSQLGSLSCRWCDRNADGSDSLNGFDRWGTDHLIWSGRSTADTLSNIGLVSVPVGMAGLEWFLARSDDASSRVILEDFVMIAEATAISGALNEGVKYAASRQRPYAHLAGVIGPSSIDDNVSFYSGHTSFVFSVATAAGTIASLRGYSHAWLVWAVGMPIATAVGYFRIAAAKHYLSDVLVGALVGGGIGAGVPLLFHGRIGEAHVQIVPGPGSVSLVGVF